LTSQARQIATLGQREAERNGIARCPRQSKRFAENNISIMDGGSASPERFYAGDLTDAPTTAR
jgi:hypothetical protein